MLNRTKNIIILSTAVLLSGCGAGGSTSSDSYSTGYFIDSPVSGLEYVTDSGIQSVTDDYGRFRYKKGDTVTFKLGKLSLGSCEPDSDGLVTPDSISYNDPEKETLMLRTLQSLDSDNNTSNGIQISDSVISRLNLLSSERSFDSVDEDFLVENLYDYIDKDYDGVIDQDETAAKEHFDESLALWRSGELPEEYYQPIYNTVTQNTFDINQYPLTENLSQDLKDALAYMGNEERLAYDTYANSYDELSRNSIYVPQLYNIAHRSEANHVEIVQSLVQRYNLDENNITTVDTPLADNTTTFDEIEASYSGVYDIPAIQSLYDTLYAKAKLSQKDALEVGCMIEVTDINDLDSNIQKAAAINATDIEEAFKTLRDGSYNHYWAFDRGLKNIGISDGCCSLGTEYCHNEYPTLH